MFQKPAIAHSFFKNKRELYRYFHLCSALLNRSHSNQCRARSLLLRSDYNEILQPRLNTDDETDLNTDRKQPLVNFSVMQFKLHYIPPNLKRTVFPNSRRTSNQAVSLLFLIAF